LAAAEDVAVNELGKVRLLGGNAEKHEQPDASGDGDDSFSMQPGYGLVQFSHDMAGAGEDTIDATATDYLGLVDTDSGAGDKTVLDILPSGGTNWSAGEDDNKGMQVSNAVDGKADFYYVDGALRSSDAAFGDSTPMWFGHIGDGDSNKKMMNNASTTVDIDTLFYDKAAKPEKPVSSTFDKDESSIRVDASHQTPEAQIADLTRTSAGSASDVIAASNLATSFGGTGTAIKQINVEIIIEPKADMVISGGDWQYDFEIKQSDGSGGFQNTKSISNVTGTGAVGIQAHVFEFASAPTVGSADWTATLNVDSMDADTLAAITVTSVEFIKSSGSYAAHTATSLTKHSFHVSLDQAAADTADSYGWAEDWECGMSLIYDGNQESFITPMYEEGGYGIEKTFTWTDNTRPPDVAIFCQYSTSWNPRITGAVFYMKRKRDKQWYPQVLMDFVKGEGTAMFSNKTRPVTYTSISSEAHYIFQFLGKDFLEPQLAITYESRTGISHEEKSISSLWKTSCVANRRAYIGNLKTFYEDGTTKLMPDTMVRSLPNKFDIFPISEKVDVTINDGEQIICLEEFNDRILQFKERTLYIINASQDMEFLEDKLEYRGVTHPSSVFKTEYGVVWANKNGCYFYDGRRVNDLLEKDGRPLINQTTWENFLGTYPLVGYSPKKRQIIVVDDISNGNNGAGSASDGSCYIYDMITTSWVKGASGTFSATIKTNFVIDWDGDLLHASSDQTSAGTDGTVQLYKWDDTADTTSKMSIITKDIDFGTPSQKKSVKKVYLTYKGDASNVQVQYGKDGATPASSFFKITSGTDGSSANTNHSTASKCIPFNAGTDDWLCAELKPSAGSVTCNSFGIKISGDGSNAIAADFEINDISIVYRPKSIK
jgi:hypothetical protein